MPQAPSPPVAGECQKAEELVPLALQRPERELTPRRVLAKRAWELSDQAMAAPGIFTHLLEDNYSEWVGDYLEWPDRVLKARPRFQMDLECCCEAKRAIECGALPQDEYSLWGVDAVV